MTRIVVAGTGAFGTALAVALSRQVEVTLWGRNPSAVAAMADQRLNPRLPGISFPQPLKVACASSSLGEADVVLLAVPAQALLHFLETHGLALQGKPLVACGKGLDLQTLEGPSATIARTVRSATPLVLTGPSFAVDLAQGLPTALTLACVDAVLGERLQTLLATPVLRLYRSTDVVGAELGGALKNVVAIACGACLGAGLGESARAALLARGFSEMRQLALARGAEHATLMGLSGLGDLVLTATSQGSRNTRFGFALGRGERFDENVTVEGAATAQAAAQLGERLGLDLPVTRAVAALVEGRAAVTEVLQQLLARPLRAE